MKTHRFAAFIAAVAITALQATVFTAHAVAAVLA
jgi:hypothetical protein